MTDSVAAQSAPRLPLPSRIIGVLTSPGDTFRSIVAHPTWFGVLAVQVIVTALAFALFLSTDVGKAAYVDQSVSSIESFGQNVTEEMYAGIQRQAEYARYIQPASIVFMAPIFAALIAALIYGVFAVLGGEATYKQVFAVLVHAGVVTMLQPIFSLPLNYQRQSMSSPTNLAVLLPMLEEGSFFASLLGVMDVFYIWWAVVLGIGLAVLYRRRTTPIVVGLLAVLVAIGVVVAAVKVALGGR